MKQEIEQLIIWLEELRAVMKTYGEATTDWRETIQCECLEDAYSEIIQKLKVIIGQEKGPFERYL